MTTTSIAPGDKVAVQTAFGNTVPKRAVSGPVPGADFTVVWVCSEEEWAAAASDDRKPNAVPWPVEDVAPA